VNDEDFNPCDVLNVDFSDAKQCRMFVDYWSSLKSKYMEDQELLSFMFEAVSTMIKDLDFRLKLIENGNSEPGAL